MSATKKQTAADAIRGRLQGAERLIAAHCEGLLMSNVEVVPDCVRLSFLTVRDAETFAQRAELITDDDRNAREIRNGQDFRWWVSTDATVRAVGWYA